jgi:cold shock CspA family protein
MRIIGTLTKWNDDRGFGFILPNQSGDEIFVHISAFPKDGIRPTLGETVSFETSIEAGKTRAIAVMRPRKASERNTKYKNETNAGFNLSASRLVKTLLLGFMAYLGYNAYQKLMPSRNTPPVMLAEPKAIETQAQFSCDGRTHCSDMRSKEEALFFIQNCPNTEMDGDRDGEPCESQF